MIRSLADAEAAKDLVEQIVGINRADDLAESLDARPSFERDQLVAEPTIRCFAGAL